MRSVPILDGLAAARAIRDMVTSGERPSAPIVVRQRLRLSVFLGDLTCSLTRAQALTASCSVQERQRCATAGMSELCPKPVKLESLRDLLRRYTAGGVRDEP